MTTHFDYFFTPLRGKWFLIFFFLLSKEALARDDKLMKVNLLLTYHFIIKVKKEEAVRVKKETKSDFWKKLLADPRIPFTPVPEYFFLLHRACEICWHEKPRWFASWKFDEDLMKLFWTILKPLPLERSLHWWRKGDLMICMLIKAGMCALHMVTSLRKCIWSL